MYVLDDEQSKRAHIAENSESMLHYTYVKRHIINFLLTSVFFWTNVAYDLDSYCQDLGMIFSRNDSLNYSLFVLKFICTAI